MLEGVGGVDRATIISSQARADECGVIILGLDADGADHTVFADGFIELFILSEFDAPQLEETQLGGKAIVRVSEADSSFGPTSYVSGVGGIAWILSGQDEYIAALLRTMP